MMGILTRERREVFETQRPRKKYYVKTEAVLMLCHHDPRNAREPPKARKDKEEVFSEAFRGSLACQHPDFRIPASRAERE